MSSYNIQRTQIVPGIRVSSAAIHYDEIWGERWQYETFIFADHTIGSRQYIHGSSTRDDGPLTEKVKKFNRRVSRLLKQRLPQPPEVHERKMK